LTAVPIIGRAPPAEPTALVYSDTTQPSHGRKREVRATTVSVRQIGKRALQLVAEELGDTSDLPRRPRTRADCAGVHRPCPFVSCQHHLYLDVSPDTGSLKYNFPDLEPDQLTDSCVLDLAARGGMTLEDVGAVMNVTRERIRQLEERATQKLERKKEGLRDYRNHAHDFDHAEIVAPQLPIVSRAALEARLAATRPPPAEPSPIVSPAVPVVSTEEVPMGGKWSPEQRAKFAATAAARRAEREADSVPAKRRKPKAAPDAPASTMDVSGLSVADLLEAHQLAQVIGIDVLRSLAARIQKGAGGE